MKVSLTYILNISYPSEETNFILYQKYIDVFFFFFFTRNHDFWYKTKLVSSDEYEIFNI